MHGSLVCLGTWPQTQLFRVTENAVDSEEEDNRVSLTEQMSEVERTNKPLIQELEARKNNVISSGLYELCTYTLEMSLFLKEKHFFCPFKATPH